MNVKTGYAQSKAVAERLVLEAFRTGKVPSVHVYRPCAISGHMVTGYGNTNDFTNLLILACIACKAAFQNPEVPIHWIPVDEVAHTIAVESSSRRSRNSRTGTDTNPQQKQVTNMVNPFYSTTLTNAVGVLNQAMGYSIRAIPTPTAPPQPQPQHAYKTTTTTTSYLL
ncbi:hypothetical protein Pelo_19622 [Pelomyxa schiedti]|nr:hypothetical protein Pelo_19622 [Pelomyxa schiedti]